MSTAHQHAALGSGPSSIASKPDANASTHMGKLLKERKRKKRGVFAHRKVDLARLYTGEDLNQLENLPAKTAKQVALERIRAALHEVNQDYVRRCVCVCARARARACVCWMK
jgi:hypothetical protein